MKISASSRRYAHFQGSRVVGNQPTKVSKIVEKPLKCGSKNVIFFSVLLLHLLNNFGSILESFWGPSGHPEIKNSIFFNDFETMLDWDSFLSDFGSFFD